MRKRRYEVTETYALIEISNQMLGDGADLRQVDGRWHIDDVRFVENRSLVGNLKEYINDVSRSCR